MISFFPAPYPDELVYSWFARYGMRTGYTHYRAIAEDTVETVAKMAFGRLMFPYKLSSEAKKKYEQYREQ